MIQFKFNDGGRSKYFKAANVSDCAVRATAIASGRDYKEIYNLYKQVEGKSPRDGVKSATCRKVMQMLGAKWVSVMKIGSGVTMHLRSNEVPQGRIVCSCSRHLTAVIDGVLNDIYDCSRDGDRAVYGYWIF